MFYCNELTNVCKPDVLISCSGLDRLFMISYKKLQSNQQRRVRADMLVQKA